MNKKQGVKTKKPQGKGNQVENEQRLTNYGGMGNIESWDQNEDEGFA